MQTKPQAHSRFLHLSLGMQGRLSTGMEFGNQDTFIYSERREKEKRNSASTSAVHEAAYIPLVWKVYKTYIFATSLLSLLRAQLYSPTDGYECEIWTRW